MKIITSSIYENGVKIGEMAQCDIKPKWTWIDFIIGVVGAILVLVVLT